jgi:hypothetical protein
MPSSEEHLGNAEDNIELQLSDRQADDCLGHASLAVAASWTDSRQAGTATRDPAGPSGAGEGPVGVSAARKQLEEVRERFNQAWSAYSDVAAELTACVQQRQHVISEHAKLRDDLVTHLLVRATSLS